MGPFAYRKTFEGLGEVVFEITGLPRASILRWYVDSSRVELSLNGGRWQSRYRRESLEKVEKLAQQIVSDLTAKFEDKKLRDWIGAVDRVLAQLGFIE